MHYVFKSLAPGLYRKWRQHMTATVVKSSCGFPIFTVLIIEKPHNTAALEGETVTLACTISDPKASVTWIRNNVAIQAGLNYDLKKNGAFHQLCICNVVPEDSGAYTCDTGDAQCEVTLTVEGKEWCHLFKKIFFLLSKFKTADQNRIEMNNCNILERPFPSTTHPVWHHCASAKLLSLSDVWSRHLKIWRNTLPF